MDTALLRQRIYSSGELVADGIVHALALLSGLIAFPLLLDHALHAASVGTFAGLVVYALGFFLMFGFSLAYNMAPPSRTRDILRRCDHAMIYMMIAGTYTAVIVQFGSPAWAWALGSVVWAGAGAGILMKILLPPGRSDWVSIGAYLVLGWVGIIAIVPVTTALPVISCWLLLAGGLTYVAGVAFYIWERLRFQNVIWHLFVAIAAALHFAAIAVSISA